MERHHRYSHPFINKLLLSIGIVFFLLITLDLVFRHYLPIPQYGYKLWPMNPGRLTCIIEPDNVRTIHKYNNYGFRGHNWSVSPCTMRRIACVGDSFTEGLGVAQNQTWPALLQKSLSAADYEVLNFGICGAGPGRYSRIISIAILFAPTDIIVCWLPSDLLQELNINTTNEPAPILENPFRDKRRSMMRPLARLFPSWMYLIDRARGYYIEQKGLFWPAWDYDWAKYTLQRIQEEDHVDLIAAQLIFRERWPRLDPAIVEACRKQYFNPSHIVSEMVHPFPNSILTMDKICLRIPRVKEDVCAWFQWFSVTCKKNNIRPWILFYPDPIQIRRDYIGPLKIEIAKQRPSIYGDTSIRDYLHDVCASNNIDFIDGMSVLLDHANERLYLIHDGHPTALAHRLIAKEVADKCFSAGAHRGP